MVFVPDSNAVHSRHFSQDVAEIKTPAAKRGKKNLVKSFLISMSFCYDKNRKIK